MKFLRLALAYLLAFAPAAEALTPMQRRVLAADQSPLANIEAFRSYVRAQKPTLFLDPDYVGSDRENLALQSEAFSNAAWSKTRSTVTADSVANPFDGATTADTLVEDGTAGNTHYLIPASALNAESGGVYRVSLYAKLKERHISLRFDGGAFSGNPYAHFNLTTCAVSSVGSGVTASVESLASSWCRITATMTATSTGAAYPSIYLASTPGTVGYNGDSASGAYIFGAQFQRASQNSSYTATTSTPVYGPSPSISSVGVVAAIGSLYGSTAAFTQGTDANKPVLSRPDRVENLAGYSQDLSQTGPWTLTRATSSVAGTDPEGFATSLITEDTTAASSHIDEQDTIPVVSGVSYRIVVDVAPNGSRNTMLRFNTGFAANTLAYFDLSLGTVSSTSGGITAATILSLGAGWYRVTAEAPATSTATGRFMIYLTNASNNDVYNGDGVSGIYVARFIIQRSSMQPTYIATTTVPVYGSLTGRRMLTFDGSNDNLTSTSALSAVLSASGGTLFSLSVPMFEDANTACSGAFYNDTSSIFADSGPYFGHAIQSVGPRAYLYNGSVYSCVSLTYALKQPVILTSWYDGANQYAYYNNQAATQAAGGTAPSSLTGTLYVGSRAAGAYFNGQLGPIITFNRVLPQPVRDTIRAGLQKFWRVP